MSSYRVLFGGDLHKLPNGRQSIDGYNEVQALIQLELINTIQKEGITHFIGLGDWYDKGYGADVSAAMAHAELDTLMSQKLDGNFYECIGNHLRLSMESNPELYLIQPTEHFKTRHLIPRKVPIIKTPNYLILNGVQISLAHQGIFEDVPESHRRLRKDGVKYHVGVYHSDVVIPREMFKPGEYMRNFSSANLDRCYEDIDYAIIGHIHETLGQMTYTHADGKQTIINVPGSLMSTSQKSYKEYIRLPLLDIDEDGNVKFSYIDLKTYSEKLTFKETRKDPVLSSMQGKSKKNLYDKHDQATMLYTEDETTVSLGSFMQSKGYTESDKSLVAAVMNTPENIGDILSIYKLGATDEMDLMNDLDDMEDME